MEITDDLENWPMSVLPRLDECRGMSKFMARRPDRGVNFGI